MSFWNFARSPASVLLMIDYGRARGITPQELLRGSQLTAGQLADPDFTVLAAQELTVASNLLKLTGNEADLGMKVGLSYHIAAYGLLGYGMMSSATGLDTIKLVRRFLALTYTYVGMSYRQIGELDSVVFEPAPELPESLQCFFVGRAMGAACRVLRDAVGSDFALAGCDFVHAAGPGGKTHVLGARVKHGQPVNQLTFLHTHMVRPLPQANAATAAMCERMCADLLARRRTRLDMASFLNEYLATHTFERPPQLKDIAGVLNTSERTLKRRLQAEGASFREISNTVRRTRAQALVEEGQLSLTEIAATLGFSDLSSFSQTYKRWTGTAPGLARQHK